MTSYKMEQVKATLFLTIKGEFDHHMAEYLRNTVDDKLRQSFIKDIVFDLTEISMMDSSGIGFIIGRYKVIRQRSGKVIIINDNKTVSRILEISGLKRLFKIVATREEAKIYLDSIEKSIG